MKSKLVIGILLLIVTTGAFLLLPKQMQRQTPISTSINSHEVILKEDGYTPDTLTIKKGETVTFKTTLNKTFWPTSNPHPTHTIYPEFDPKNAIKPAEDWSFKFEKVGKWGYHDHISPFYTGTIIVTDK